MRKEESNRKNKKILAHFIVRGLSWTLLAISIFIAFVFSKSGNPMISFVYVPYSIGIVTFLILFFSESKIIKGLLIAVGIFLNVLMFAAIADGLYNNNFLGFISSLFYLTSIILAAIFHKNFSGRILDEYFY